MFSIITMLGLSWTNVTVKTIYIKFVLTGTIVYLHRYITAIYNIRLK